MALAACGTAGAPPVAQQQFATSTAERSSVSSVLFVADSLANKIWMFPAGQQHGSTIGAITAGVSSPQALHVDSNGVLYVTNSNTVTEYKPGETTPFRTLTNVRGGTSIAVDSKGTVYVGQGCSIFPSGGSIAVFSNGTLPSRTIALNDCSFMGGMTSDRSNNLIVTFFQYPQRVSHAVKFAPGASTGRELALQGISGIDSGLAVDASENIYASGSNGNSVGINVYAPNATQPSRTISSGINGATGIAFNSSGALFVANFPGPAGGSFVSVYAPGGSTPVNSFSGNLTAIFGVAVRPAL